MALKIGFKEEFFTLWSVSEPYKVYTTEHTFYWRTDCDYIRNLSKDEEIAKLKAKNFGAVDLEVHNGLRGVGRSFSTNSEIYDETPFYIYPSKIHRYGSGDIRRMGSDRATEYDNEQEIKALWTLYLKKEIVFCGKNSCRPEWKKPIVLARRRLLELGILVRYDKQVLAASYLERYKELQKLKEIKSGLKIAHHYTDSQRLVLKVVMIDLKTYFNDFGSYSLITLADENNNEYKYKGNTSIEFSKENFIEIKGTIFHNTYNGIESTRLKRITLVKTKAS